MASTPFKASMPPGCLFEAAAWHYAVVAECLVCGREAVFDPHALWWLFPQKRWDERTPAVRQRLRCEACGNDARITFDRDRAVTRPLPLPSEREWKQAVSRYRS